MEAIILAAGLGTRLRPHTLTTPKPLLPVQGRPILDWTLSALPPEVDRVVVVVNYLADQIRDFMATQRHVADWETVQQTQPRGTGDALRSCRGKVGSDRFLVLNGDDLYGAADLQRLAEVDAGLLVVSMENPTGVGVVIVDDQGRVTKLIEKQPMKGRHWVNIGAYAFPQRAMDIDLPLSPRGEYEITDAVTAIAATQEFRIVPSTFWLPIGTVEAWQAAQTTDLTAMRRS
jgi:bifunctional UDP-N-acetylglucosamine pyrophosphorylase/glucosamine-1-phosphate N-acetyltransferase